MSEVAEKQINEEVVKETPQKEVEEKVVEKVVEEAEEEVKKDESVDAEKVNGNESEVISSDLSKNEKSIIRQVEYYFGDMNLKRDKFLIEQISKTEEGWVPISVLLTFKRLASYTDKITEIVDAVMKSDNGIVEISEDNEKIRRHPERPIPLADEENRKEIMSRTAYAKGFPLTSTMSELLEFFNQFERVENIIMRKYVDKPTKTYKFKGSVFATFATKEQAQEFIDKDIVENNDRKLIRKWQEKYIEEKREEHANKNAARKQKTVIDAPVVDDFQLPKGTVFFFEGATDKITREKLREVIEATEGDWNVAFIEYNRGEENGHIRFREENAAVKFVEQNADKKLKIEDIDLTMRLLEDEEETEFLEKAQNSMKNRRAMGNNKNKKFNSRKRSGSRRHYDNKKSRN